MMARNNSQNIPKLAHFKEESHFNEDMGKPSVFTEKINRITCLP